MSIDPKPEARTGQFEPLVSMVPFAVFHFKLMPMEGPMTLPLGVWPKKGDSDADGVTDCIASGV